MRKIFFCPMLCLAVLSCGDNPVQPTPAAPVASVSLDPGTSDLVPAQTVQLNATPRDSAGTAQTGRTITWISSSVSVATVKAGLVTGVAPGTATITATLVPGDVLRLGPSGPEIEVGFEQLAVVRSR